MATLPPLTGGPGVYVPVIMQAAWAQAAQLSGLVDDRVDDALALASTAPSVPLPDSVISPVMPAAPSLPALDQTTATALFDSTREDIVNLLVGKFSEFLATYFPQDDYVAEAEDWVTRALQGGTGVNTAVEAQLWERARARALQDGMRAQDELSVAWAARRFPVPPGAYMHASLQITKGTQDAIAGAAREQAVKTFETEVANVRFAVERAIAMRTLAVQSAGDYIRALATGPQVAVQAASSILSAQTAFSAALTNYYQAQVAAVEVPVRVATTNAELKTRTNEANLRAAIDTMGRRVDAVVSNAQMLATQAAAAFNAMHTQASVAGNDSTVTSIQG